MHRDKTTRNADISRFGRGGAQMEEQHPHQHQIGQRVAHIDQPVRQASRSGRQTAERQRRRVREIWRSVVRFWRGT